MSFPIRTSRKTKKLCNDFEMNKYIIMKDYDSALRKNLSRSQSTTVEEL